MSIGEPLERKTFEAWSFFSKMNPSAQEYAWRGWQARAAMHSFAGTLVRDCMPYLLEGEAPAEALARLTRELEEARRR